MNKSNELLKKIREAFDAGDDTLARSLLSGLTEDEFMEVSSALINDSVFSNPKLEYVNTAYTMDGKPYNLRGLFLPIGMLINDLMDHLSCNPNFDNRFMLISPKFILTPNPIPNAYTAFEGLPQITINLGLLIAISALPSITNFIEDTLKNRSISFKDLNRFKPTSQMLHEVGELIKCWKLSRDNQWQQIIFPGSEGLTSWGLFQEMQKFVIAHEFGHWFQSIYKKEALENLLNITESHIKEWLRKDSTTNKAVLKNIRNLLKNPDILHRWEMEVCADQMAFHTCIQAFGAGWSPVLRMYHYAGIAMVFAMDGLLELFFKCSGTPVTCETHPSSYARFMIFAHIRAKEMSLSMKDFLFKEWGSAVLVSQIMATIILAYEETNKSR